MKPNCSALLHPGVSQKDVRVSFAIFFSPNFGCAACAIASALPLCRLCRRRCRWLYIRFALFLSGFVHHLSSLLLYLFFSRASSVPVLHSLRCFFSILPLFASFILFTLCAVSLVRCSLLALPLLPLLVRVYVHVYICACHVCTCVRCLVQDACLPDLTYFSLSLSFEFVLFVWVVSLSLSYLHLITLANTLMESNR